MDSLTELYSIGFGPSSSHTMGPAKAAAAFRQETSGATSYTVIFYGSLAATGEGHLTDIAVAKQLLPAKAEFEWCPDIVLPLHPNGMEFIAYDTTGKELLRKRIYSIGGGALRDEDGPDAPDSSAYPLCSMSDILHRADESGVPLWDYVRSCEEDKVWMHLAGCWEAMKDSLQRGLTAEGVLPGKLCLPRKAHSYLRKAKRMDAGVQRTGVLSAYALAVAEENAAGGKVVTAPTCGSCGVLPAVLSYLQDICGSQDDELLHALAVAGLFGNVAKSNASISGAEVGCQGEIGVACAMAAAAAAYLLGGSNSQIEYAAEMGLEHHLGLTCDPVMGLVQIPCIERNAMAALRALDCAEYALLSDGRHRISFDQVVLTMKTTGHDLPSLYRETSAGGLAKIFACNPKGRNRE